MEEDRLIYRVEYRAYFPSRILPLSMCLGGRWMWDTGEEISRYGSSPCAPPGVAKERQEKARRMKNPPLEFLIF